MGGPTLYDLSSMTKLRGPKLFVNDWMGLKCFTRVGGRKQNLGDLKHFYKNWGNLNCLAGLGDLNYLTGLRGPKSIDGIWGT